MYSNNLIKQVVINSTLAALTLGVSMAPNALAADRAPHGQIRKEYTCRAQCVYVNPDAYAMNTGYLVEGWSRGSVSEAFRDMQVQCSYPGVLVLKLAGSHYGENEFEGDYEDEFGATYSVEAQRGESDRRHRVRPAASARFRASAHSRRRLHERTRNENNIEFDLQFVTKPEEACGVYELNTNAPIRYLGGRPLGG